jgi:tRNA nucleotidyltransferase/poly(A) polymerase
MIYDKKYIQKHFPLVNFHFIEDEVLKKIILAVNGRFIGGVVRDGLLGIITDDMDISTPLLPEKVMEILTSMNFNPIPTGIAYGTISLFLKKYKIEITSLRKDVENYGRKAQVSFNGTWEDDSIRRDFTFNALYLAPIYTNEINNEITYNIYDYHKGLEDLQNNKVKFIGDYKLRIKEDYLRIMRFIRFFLRYGNNQEETYKEEINFLREFVPHMTILSIERILMETNNILKIKNYKLGVEIINELGISKLFFEMDLYMINKENNLNTEDRFLILFHKVSSNIIKKLPLEKSIKTFLNKFQDTDWSVESLGRIFYQTKNINLIKHMINIYNIINNSNIFPHVGNLTEEDFNNFKSHHVFVNNEGPERGEEELQLRINFISDFLI